MNNFIQHVTGQLVWLGEHRGLFFAVDRRIVCRCVFTHRFFFQLKNQKNRNEAAGVFKGRFLDPLVYPGNGKIR